MEVCRQCPDTDLHDRLEARHHLAAVNIATAIDITKAICDRPYTIDAWDRETTLIHQTLTLIPPGSPTAPPGTIASGSLPTSRVATPAPNAAITKPSSSLRNSTTAPKWPHSSSSGSLAAERGQVADAIRLHLQALPLHQQIGAPQTALSLKELHQLRQQMERQVFLTTGAEVFPDEDGRRNLETLLDSVPESGRDTFR